MDKPHIVHILGTMGMGGAQKVVLELATNSCLSDYKHSVVCLLSDKGEFWDLFRSRDISVVECPALWPHSTPIPSYRINRWLRQRLFSIFGLRLAASLKNLKPDLVNNHLVTYSLIQARVTTERLKIPWIWTVHGLYKSRGILDDSQLHKIVERVNQSNAAIVGVSKAVLDDLDVYDGIKDNKLFVIGNPISSEILEAPPKKRIIQWHRDYSIPDSAIVFGTAARLIEVKRIDLFISAAAQLLQMGQEAYFLVAGEGPIKNKLQMQIDQLGIGKHFQLIGYVSDMPAFLRELDVFVLPSVSESFSMAIVEACAVGIPCIATNVGGIPEMLGDGTGIVIRPESITDLVEAMREMLKSEVRVKYSKTTTHIKNRFSSEAIGRQYRSLYDKLIVENNKEAGL
jgi:glycosyltransferase involved in cell wall biosynthesis